MRKRIVVGAVAMGLLFAAGVASADMGKDDVAKIVKMKADNKKIDESLGRYPDSQAVLFATNGVNYTIDLQAQLCFAGQAATPAPVPCQKLKKGYPLIAPLITWDD